VAHTGVGHWTQMISDSNVARYKRSDERRDGDAMMEGGWLQKLKRLHALLVNS
jgi:hypothetical protein